MSYTLFVFYNFISHSCRFTDFYFLRSEIIFGVYYLLSLAYFVPQRYLFYWNDGINVRRSSAKKQSLRGSASALPLRDCSFSMVHLLGVAIPIPCA